MPWDGKDRRRFDPAVFVFGRAYRRRSLKSDEMQLRKDKGAIQKTVSEQKNRVVIREIPYDHSPWSE